MPSVSAAIGYSFRTAFFWLICIMIHAPFRFKVAKLINKSYEKSIVYAYSSDNIYKMRKSDTSIDCLKQLIRLAYHSNRCEIVGLIILSTFTSNSNYGKYYNLLFIAKYKISCLKIDLHKLGFSMYLISALLYSILVCYLENCLKRKNMVNF